MCKFSVVSLIVILILVFTFSPVASASDFQPQTTTEAPTSSCCDGGDCCIINDCSCPNCEGRGEPGGNCELCGSDLCENCGNCFECGTSPCPVCTVDSGEDEDNDEDEAPLTISTNNGADDIGLGAQLVNSVGSITWTITNLVLAALGIILTIVALILSKRKRDAQSYARGDNHARRFRTLGVTMLMLCVAGIALFFFTQTITRHIVLFDNYTIVHAILLLAIAFFTARMNRRIEEQKYVITQTAWEV